MTAIFGGGFLATAMDQKNQCQLGRTGGIVEHGLVAG